MRPLAIRSIVIRARAPQTDLILKMKITNDSNVKFMDSKMLISLSNSEIRVVSMKNLESDSSKIYSGVALACKFVGFSHSESMPVIK